jgi:HAD superfamily hydrolase (TIGR01509 family)
LTRAARPIRRPAAVIFDMDGLMLDTEPLAARAWIDAAAACGVAFDRVVVPRLIGRNFPDCRALIRAHHGDDYPVDELMCAWQVAYDAIVEREGIALKPGLGELLDWLESEAIPKAVATSTRRSRAEAKLAHTFLLGRFAALVGGDEVARGKPEPDIFVLAALRLGVETGECLVLEDSEPGVRGAAAAGMPAIMVPDVHAPSPSLADEGHLVLRTLHDVRALLAALPARAARGDRPRPAFVP